MRATCEYCGTGFDAKRATARYCSSSHRSMASQKRARAKAGGEVVQLHVAPPAPDEPPADDDPPAERVPGPIEAAAIKELTDAGKLDTTLGQTAVALARRVDKNFGDTGSALAGLAREMRATLDAATVGARPADELDALRGRRHRKTSGA